VSSLGAPGGEEGRTQAWWGEKQKSASFGVVKIEKVVQAQRGFEGCGRRMRLGIDGSVRGRLFGDGVDASRREIGDFFDARAHPVMERLKAREPADRQD